MSELRFESWLCYAHGESDLPQARFCRTLAEMREFLVDEWFGDPKDPELDELMEELNTHDWSEGSWTIKFEIGGVKIEKVWACTPTHGALPVSPEVTRTTEQVKLELDPETAAAVDQFLRERAEYLEKAKGVSVGTYAASAAARPDAADDARIAELEAEVRRLQDALTTRAAIDAAEQDKPVDFTNGVRGKFYRP